MAIKRVPVNLSQSAGSLDQYQFFEVVVNLISEEEFLCKKFQPLPSYQLTRFAGVFGPHMAEYVVGHIIYRERKFQEMKARQIERKW